MRNMGKIERENGTSNELDWTKICEKNWVRAGIEIASTFKTTKTSGSDLLPSESDTCNMSKPTSTWYKYFVLAVLTRSFIRQLNINFF
jgi:hypothetical protein